MRYLIDTNIIVYIIADPDSLSRDVKAIISESDALLYACIESAKELVVAYRNKKLLSSYWKSPEEMLRYIETEHFIQFLPMKIEHIITYSKMYVNERDNHKDPSDHVIIAHAITERMPLISSDRKFEFYRSQGLDFIFNEK